MRRPAEVERLEIGFHAPEVAHADSYAVQVLATLLGTGKTSRLYQRLIEKEQSAIRQSVDYTERIDPGLFVVRVEVKPQRVLSDLERSVLDEIDRLGTDPVTGAELDRAKRLLRAEFVLGHEEVSSQAITLGLYETINCYEYVSDHIARMEAVTADDVRLVTERYLGADNRTVGHLVAEGEVCE